MIVTAVLMSACATQTSKTTAKESEQNQPTAKEQSAERQDIQKSTSQTKTEAITLVPEIEDTPFEDSGLPKYVFIIIGDGAGEGHLRLGEMYARIREERMDATATCESFEVKQMVTGGSESACGGTALATGYMGKPSAISVNRNNEPLYTILDRAKENGMGTGVVTNSNIQDATPATFLTHAESRLDEREISEGLVYSGVDYIAGGGMNYIISREQAVDFDYVDVSYNELKPNRYITYHTLLEEDYRLYLGLPGAQDFLSDIENETFVNQRTLAAFSELVMPYEPTKYIENYVERMTDVPSLVDMTEAGIQILSQNPNGFVMMIEEALIDKAEHRDRTVTSILQVDLIDRVIAQIQAFADQHPGEVLIILTADHETGYYMVDDAKYNAFLKLTELKWTPDTADMYTFLTDEWDLKISYDRLYDRLKLYGKGLWETERENKTPAKQEIAYTTSLKYGIKSCADTHTFLPVPCYADGAGAEYFFGIERIDEIPIQICEMFGWEALPQAIETPNLLETANY